MQKKVMEHLLESESIALFVHTNPDWDCIGSAFALRAAMRALEKKCDIFTEEKLGSYLSFMESDVITYEEGFFPDYQTYCAVDVGELSRLGKWEKAFSLHKDTVCIDHHIKKAGFAALSYIESERSCTGELIFELLSLKNIPVTKKIADYLYLAMSSDTGSFQYASVNRRTYEILIALYDAGVDAAYLSSMLYERETFTQMKLKAAAIESMRVYGGGKICTAKITAEDMEKYGASKSDTEGLAQLPRKLDGVMASAFLSDRPDGTVRVSLRASGNYNIEPIARLFGGGGHKRAAGCTFNTDINTAEEILVKELLKL